MFVCSSDGHPSEGIGVMHADGSGTAVLVDDPSVPEDFSTWGAAPG